MISVETDHPLAEDSVDHQFPRGTMNDSSVEPEFNRRLFELYPDHLSLLDLGCAGGGFVESLLRDGANAIGIEGSDYSLQRCRAAWAQIPSHLYTADIRYRFDVCRDERLVRFDVVTAWEVLEHLPFEHLDGVLSNIERHLVPRGLFLGSVAYVHDQVNGVEYHATVQPVDWWERLFEGRGWVRRPDLLARFDGCWIRGRNKGDASEPLAMEWL